MTGHPCLVDGCPETFAAAPLLAAHLVDAHLWKGSTAYLRASAAFGNGSAEPRPAAATSTTEPSMPHAKPSRKGPFQAPMSERTCGACGKKGHRKDHCPTSTPAITKLKAAIAEHERQASALREALVILEG